MFWINKPKVVKNQTQMTVGIPTGNMELILRSQDISIRKHVFHNDGKNSHHESSRIEPIGLMTD